MLIGFERRVEKLFIDFERMVQDGKIDQEVVCPNGYATAILVPKNLAGKVVVVMPLDDAGKPLDIQKLIDESVDDRNAESVENAELSDEVYQMKVCEKCGCEFATFSELEFDSENLCQNCRDRLRQVTS